MGLAVPLRKEKQHGNERERGEEGGMNRHSTLDFCQHFYCIFLLP